MHLDVIVEDQVLMLVALQESVGVLQLEVLELQHCLGPPAHHCLHKLIQNLHGMTKTAACKMPGLVFLGLQSRHWRQCQDQEGHPKRS